MFVVFADKANIYHREFNIACMHAAKRRYSTKIKSAKSFLKAFPRKFIPSKYTRYTIRLLSNSSLRVNFDFTRFSRKMY